MGGNDEERGGDGGSVRGFARRDAGVSLLSDAADGVRSDPVRSAWPLRSHEAVAELGVQLDELLG